MGWLVSNGHVTSDGLMFDYLLFSPFAVTILFVRAKASIHPRMMDDAVMHVVAKGDVFEFKGRGRTKNWILLCDFRQDWF